MADLKIKILGDASSLSTAMKKAKGGVAEFGRVMSSVLGGATVVMAGMATAFYKFKQIIDPVAGKLDDVGKAAKRIGISTSDFQELGFVARRTGVDTTVVEKAFRRLQKTIGDAGRGLSTSVVALDALSLSFDKLDGKMPIDQFRIVARELAGIEDVTKRNAIAQDVFGTRVGTAIAPMIEQYERLTLKLRVINGVMSEDSVRAAEKYKDELENLQVVVDSLIAASGSIGFMAEQFERLEATLTGLRRGTGVLKELATTMGKTAFFDLLSGNVNPLTLVKGLAGGAGSVGGQEQAARLLFSGFATAFKPKGGGGTAGGAGATAVSQLLNAGTLGGGGTLASLGGDISGGGFSARMNIQEKQLGKLTELTDLQKELVETMKGFTSSEIGNFVEDYKDIFKN